MGGVDVYDSRHKKWWMRIYYFLIDTAITNAHVLYKDSPRTKKTTHQEFVLSMIILLGSTLPRTLLWHLQHKTEHLQKMTRSLNVSLGGSHLCLYNSVICLDNFVFLLTIAFLTASL